MQLTPADLAEPRAEFETTITFPRYVTTEEIILVGIDETIKICGI